MDVTLTGLLNEIRRYGSIPNTAVTGSQDTDMVAYLNRNLMSCASEVIKCREGFMRRYKDHTLVSGQTRYRIPTRAIGNRLDAVLFLDSAGKVLRKLDEVPYGVVSNFRNVTDTMGYHLEAGDVVLTPIAPTGQVATIRMVYYIRPAEIVDSLDEASGSCFTVTAVAGNVLTLMASHGLTTGTKIDIMKGGPPFEYLSVDENPSAVGASTVTVADGSRVEVGDYVCKADKAPIAQVPDVFYPVLAAMAAQEYWLALGDGKEVDRLEMMLWGESRERNNGMIGQAKAIISPRVEEGAKKIMSPYGVMGALWGPARRVY